MNVIISILAVVLMAAALGWAADLYRHIGLLLYPQQFLSAMLALALPLVFLTRRARQNHTHTAAIPWYDSVLAGAGFAGAGFMAVTYPEYAELVFERPLSGLLIGTLVMLLAVEGLRRTVGLVLTGVVVLFFILGLLGHTLPDTLAGMQLQPPYLLYYLAWDPTAMLGTPLVVVTTIVTTFVLFGQVLLQAGGAEFFTELSMRIVGRYRGGQAKIAVTASALFGSISGSAVSNVATTGVITIPLMRKAGYSAVQAGAIEAVASTGGQLMPPIMGAAAFLMAEFLQISYSEVVIVALVPALLYYAALFIITDLEAGRRNILPAADQQQLPAWSDIIRGGWYFPLPFVVLIGGLFYLNYTPEYSALLATLSMALLALTIGYKGRRMSLFELLQAVRATGLAVLDIIMIGVAAGLVIGILSISGLGFALTLALVHLGGGSPVAVLLLAALICIILGMGMPTAGVYILLAALVAPSLVEIGIAPIAAHLFILYFGMMSMITPPVAIAAFAAASLSGADAMQTGFTAMRFGWVAYVVPFIFVFSPTLLLQGDWLHITIDVATALLAVWVISAAMIGYHVRVAGWIERIILALAGLVLLLPAAAFSWPLLVHSAAALVVAALILPTVRKGKVRVDVAS
jgi:TRAP transporter 4TM/12TM fusion protein